MGVVNRKIFSRVLRALLFYTQPPLSKNPGYAPGFWTIIFYSNTRDDYRMAGNFRGVLIFVIYVVDWQSRRFPPTKINAYGTGNMSP